MTITPTERLMSTQDVVAYTGGIVTASTLRWWRHEGKGRGPKSFRLGGKKVAYRKSDVDAWLEASYAEAV